MQYQEQGTPLVVLAGASTAQVLRVTGLQKGSLLLGIKAVIAKSYERIHRSNLIGMGVLPLQFKEGEGHEELGLTGKETFDINGLFDKADELIVIATDEEGNKTEFKADVRIDTPKEWDYYKHGGILQYVLRQMVA